MYKYDTMIIIIKQDKNYWKLYKMKNGGHNYNTILDSFILIRL